MKKIILTLTLLLATTLSQTAQAATDIQIIEAALKDESLIKKLSTQRIDDVQINQLSENRYKVTVNSKAPLADGCSYSVFVTVTEKAYAINPLTTGLQSVFYVSRVKSVCAQRAVILNIPVSGQYDCVGENSGDRSLLEITRYQSEDPKKIELSASLTHLKDESSDGLATIEYTANQTEGIMLDDQGSEPLGTVSSVSAGTRLTLKFDSSENINCVHTTLARIVEE